MELVARVVLVGFDGEPVDAAIALEGYDLRQKAWRGIPEILKPLRAVAKASRDAAVHQIAFTLNEPALLALFAATAFFRLVTPSPREGGQAQVILASERIAWTSERVELDFGTVLFLGERGGFITLAGEGGAFCSGVALAAEDAALAEAQRRFYARPREAEEAAADRDRAQVRLAELETAHAAVRKALSACEAAGARLTRDNAALTQQVQKAAADLQACDGERVKLTEQVAAAIARAAAAETSLKACTAERERMSAELAARTKALAAVTAERDACAGERVKLAEQLAAATARAAAAEEERKRCVVERERAARELAARTEALATAIGERDACTQAREALASQLAEARADLDATIKQWEELRTEFRHGAEARAKAESDLEACRARTVELEEAIRGAGAALEACRLAGAEADRRAKAAEEAHTALNDRLLVMEAETQLRGGELAELRERISNEHAYVGRLKETLIAETAKAGVAVQQLEAARQQYRSETPATELIANLATSFGGVNRELVAADIPYRLGRTDITLRTFFSGDGARMSLPDAAYRIDEAALSEIVMELLPDDAPAVPAPGGLIVPNLLGLTETAVIRVLSSLFLKADKAIETVVEPAKHGRALHQMPKAGAAAERGETVLVVYGAEEGA